MSIQIILIRHGIAESASPGQTDYDKRLTEKGTRQLRDTLPSLIPLITRKQEMQIWSSPLTRTRETAEIAADILHCERIEFCDFIGDGNFNEFWSAVHKLDPRVGHTIIVVGHEPDMSKWTEALCGRVLPFKKGAAACCILKKGDSKQAKFQWFYLPEEMALLSRK